MNKQCPEQPVWKVQETDSHFNHFWSFIESFMKVLSLILRDALYLSLQYLWCSDW